MTLKVRKKWLACHCCLFGFWLSLENKSKNVCFIFLPAVQGSVALSQLTKRHEMNLVSMAFSHETPRHIVKVTLHSPLIP